MNRFLTYLVAAMMLLFTTNSCGLELSAASPATGTVKTVRWEGTSGYDMLKQARADIESAKAENATTLRVDLFSAGGPVLMGMEIARIMRDASDAGLIVEIHAAAQCASACTFILAAGTTGHRFVSRYTLILVHAAQRSDECITRTPKPTSQFEKTDNAILDLMRDHYARYTGVAPKAIEKWLTCGNEQAGEGDLAVRLHLADATE